MELGVWVLLALFLTFQFVFIGFDFQRNDNMKQTIFESLRASNQNALYEIQDKYDEYETITTSEMLESWLINFCNNNSLEYEKIDISFLQIETEPVPLYLAYVEGYKDDYIILNEQAVTSYLNGAMLIEETEEE